MEIDVQQLITQLGLSAVFLLMLYWLSQRYVELLNRKDKDLSDLNLRLITLIENNTKAMVEMKAAITELRETISDNLQKHD